MKIHINKARTDRRTNSLAKDYQPRFKFFKTSEPHLIPKRLLLLISLLIGLNTLVVAQTTTSNPVNLTNFVNKSQAVQGQTITHTLVLTNSGTTTVSGIVVRDSISTGLRYLTSTSYVPPGTTFTVGVPISTWSVPTLSAGQSLSLTYQAVADSSGVLYSIATIPGDTAASCTSIPVRVCEGDAYLFQLTGPAGRSTYQWFKDGVEITDQNTRVLNVTAPGSYSLSVDNTVDKCPGYSLCPFIIEKYALPAFQVSAISASCSGSTAQTNGQIKLMGFSATDTYQYSEGTDFNPSASLSGTPTVIPADGLIASNLPNPTANKTYTIRVYNASGCYVEKTVTLVPASCCSLVATATPSACDIVTNTFSSTVAITLVNPTSGVLILTDGPLSQTVAATGSGTVTAVFAAITSDGSAHTVTVSLAGCSSTSATYTAPASCSVAPPQPRLALSVNPGSCAPATNLYTLTGSLSLSAALATTLTLTDGASSTTLAVSEGQITAPFTLEGLLSDGASHTLTVSGTGYDQVSATYTAPASCSVAPPQPRLALSVNPGSCAPATNHYTLTGTLSLSAALATTLTLSTGTQSTTLAITDGQSSADFTLKGLLSDGASHTLTVSGAGYDQVSATFTAPASCSVAPPQPRLALSVNPGSCAPATNHYTLTGSLSLSAALATTLTLTDGASSTTLAITQGQTTASFTLEGLLSDGASHTLTVSGTGYDQVSATFKAPASCSVAPALPGLTLSVTDPGVCNPGSNLYTSTGVITFSNASAGMATITDGMITKSISISAGATSVPYSLTGLRSGSGVHTVTVSFVSQSASTTYVAPESCTIASPVPAVLALEQLVDKSKAKIGELISYTIVLTNTGGSSSAETTVQLSKTAGLAYIPSSATPPAGTVFSPGGPFSSWTVASISAGESLSLVLQAKADTSGILHNTATIPGDTARVCTSVPVKVCVGESYLFRLTATPGRSHYQWSRTFQGLTTELTSFTANVLDVTQPGEYRLTTTDQPGQCPDFSCCPFLVEQDSLPTFQAKTLSTTCTGDNPQANGHLVISGFQSTNTYQYSLGSSFNGAASLSGVAKAIPANGILASNLINPAAAQPYTIRVYNESGCYEDVTVLLQPTECGCPAVSCTPLLLTQTKRNKRIGDPR